jgi:hypothetical protein
VTRTSWSFLCRNRCSALSQGTYDSCESHNAPIQFHFTCLVSSTASADPKGPVVMYTTPIQLLYLPTSCKACSSIVSSRACLVQSLLSACCRAAQVSSALYRIPLSTLYTSAALAKVAACQSGHRLYCRRLFLRVLPLHRYRDPLVRREVIHRRGLRGLLPTTISRVSVRYSARFVYPYMIASEPRLLANSRHQPVVRPELVRGPQN